MNKKELEIFGLACTFLKLRGFTYWKEMFDILNKVSTREKKRKEKSVEYIRKKRINDPLYARSYSEKNKK